MRILVAPDKFKGSATASEVAAAMATACRAGGHTVVIQPLADGGEGTVEALGGANRVSEVTGPLGTPVTAEWRLAGPTAVIEMAAASGLTLAGGPEGNDPVAATTAGTGQLIDIAIQRGARQVIVAAGGSATTDGGLGALEAIKPLQRLRGIDLQVACDIRGSFLDAVAYAAQKGATPAQVELLRRRLDRLAQMYFEERGVDVTTLARAGAAGGLAGGLASVGATLVDGFELVADAVGLYEAMAEVDLVLTGEGRIDATSFDGKVVGGVASLAADAEVPVVVIAGAAGDLGSPPDPISVHTLIDAVGTERAFTDTAASVSDVTAAVVRGLVPRQGT